MHICPLVLREVELELDLGFEMSLGFVYFISVHLAIVCSTVL